MGDYNKQPGSSSVFDMMQNCSIVPKLPDALFADGELLYQDRFPAFHIAPNIQELQDKISILQKRVDELEREKLFRQLQDENISIKSIMQEMKLPLHFGIIRITTQADKFKILPVTFGV